MSSAAKSRGVSGGLALRAAVAAALVWLWPTLPAAQGVGAPGSGPVDGGPADPASPGAAVIKPLESVVPHPASQGAQRPLAAADGRFLGRAHAGLQARIDVSRLAARDGSHPCVKKFAAELVHDYGHLAEEVGVLAAARRLALPGRLPAADRRLLAALQRLSGAAFDRRYGEAMRDAHGRDLAFLDRAGAGLADAEIKSLARTLRAAIEERADMARDLATVVGGTTVESAGGATPAGCAMF